MTDEKNCPVCNPPPKHEPDIVKAMRNRLDDGRIGLWPTDQSLMLQSIREIEKLRAYVRTLNGQLAHIAGLSSNTVENLKRNLKTDGGWSLD